LKTREFLSRIHTHTKSIYQNEIVEVTENGKIMNWFLGLAGVALLFSFNQYNSLPEEHLGMLLAQALVFILIIVVGLLHRVYTKKFRSHTTAIIRMFDFLLIEFELVPDEITSALKDERFGDVFDNYINGVYFGEEDEPVFEQLVARQRFTYRLTNVLALLSILLMIIQFGLFFLLVLKN
jgi:hypothetical protein